MYFCPNCSYLFDISKSSKVLKNDDTRISINKTIDALKKLEEKEDFTKYKASFSKDIMAKNKKLFTFYLHNLKLLKKLDFLSNATNVTEYLFY